MILKMKLKKYKGKKAESTRVRSECLQYEEGEKSKFFLNLEKRRGIQGQHQEDSEWTLVFLWKYNRNMSANTSEDWKHFLNQVSVPKLNYEDTRICEGD